MRWLIFLAAVAAAATVPDQEYFDEYGLLAHHMSMLLDGSRMHAYRSAILGAKAAFEGKVVLDVGTGTGVLAIWAAQAGARKVYAVEQSAVVADHARTLVAAHGLSDVVAVLTGAVEAIELPEATVDIVLSEWMGYALLRESMAASVLFARDKWLEEGGLVFPSRARLVLAPLDTTSFVERRAAELADHLASFDEVTAQLADGYGIDLASLRAPYAREHLDELFRRGWVGDVPAEDVSAEYAVLLDVDMRDVKAEALFDWKKSVAFEAKGIKGFALWFDVSFCFPGGAEPCVTLDTAPGKETHWGQTAFLLSPPLAGEFSVSLARSRAAKHDIEFAFDYAPSGAGAHPELRGDGSRVTATYQVTAEVKGYGEIDADEAYGEDEDDRRSCEDGGTCHRPLTDVM